MPQYLSLYCSLPRRGNPLKLSTGVTSSGKLFLTSQFGLSSFSLLPTTALCIPLSDHLHYIFIALYTIIISLFVSSKLICELFETRSNILFVFYTLIFSPWLVNSGCAISICLRKERVNVQKSLQTSFCRHLIKYIFSFKYIVTSKCNIFDCHAVIVIEFWDLFTNKFRLFLELYHFIEVAEPRLLVSCRFFYVGD